ncbi:MULTISPECIES: hypothetical protein [Cysteiniphilum]|uniref:hypothetical protein n=1 Tax=Cysteiniphilum TaxID=2056696 RepID=UPI0017852A0E|nr:MULTISPECIES: hypothetical protein [Cysteiniphilum]
MRYWHASLVTNNIDTGLLVIGAPNVGKTEFCYHLIKYLGFYLVADDLVGIAQINNVYQGSLCNSQYFAVMHHKEKDFIQVEKAVDQSVISHVVYLYRQVKDPKYINKAQTLALPLIEIDVFDKAWHACAKQLQNRLG